MIHEARIDEYDGDFIREKNTYMVVKGIVGGTKGELALADSPFL